MCTLFITILPLLSIRGWTDLVKSLLLAFAFYVFFMTSYVSYNAEIFVNLK